MNTFSFQTTDENGLSFMLLVDGRPLGALVGAKDWAFPYFDVLDDLPRSPPHGERAEPEVRIVCCCSSGYYGCAHAYCRVVHEGDGVVFRDVDHDTSSEGRRKAFRFPASNYKTVVSEIVAKAKQRQTKPV